MPSDLSRDDHASAYLDQLVHEPYPFQEEALLTWFTTEQGVLICAPTGMGKTLIAEAALFEALSTGKQAYYTTPLIALTEQKFQEVQAAAVRWGFREEDVGLVTGNRKVNPDATVLVVVAEILLNRLLDRDAFDFTDVSSVVMDEFHSFNDPERGIVWELSLGMLPKSVRLMLLSATVGNTAEFLIWLNKSHGRRLDLVQSTERKVPLRHHWVEDQLLNEQVERMATGDDETRKTPMLLFCFNRDECWSVAEQLKGKSLLGDGQQKQLDAELKQYDWSQGAGPKLKTILLRGVGVHHAGLLAKYKRVVERLFQRKLLTVCVCTETLAAGINLPARSVLLNTLLKGPPGKKKLIDPSSAHQMFGRAGRPQFDTEGHVFSLAHEDDVKIARAKRKMDQIPEDTKDPLLIKKRKQLKKKLPKRRTTVQYWNETQFERLIESPPGNLMSQGNLPWRLLAYLLSFSHEVEPLRRAVRKRLMTPKQIESAEQRLTEMLLTLEAGGYVNLVPKSPQRSDESASSPDEMYGRIRSMADTGEFGEPSVWDGQQRMAWEDASVNDGDTGGDEDGADFGAGLSDDDGTTESDRAAAEPESVSPSPGSTTSQPGPMPKETRDTTATSPEGAQQAEPDLPGTSTADGSVKESDDSTGDGGPVKLTSSLKFLLEAQGVKTDSKGKDGPKLKSDADAEEIAYEPEQAYPNESMPDLLTFRSINPLYAFFLLKMLPHADGAERIQALESVLEFPGSLCKPLRIPRADTLPPSSFTTRFLGPELLQRGLASQAELSDTVDKGDPPSDDPADWTFPLSFPDKLKLLFQAEFPGVGDVRITSVWAAGELLRFNGDFNKLVTSRKIARQEGVLFRHILRFILLCEEFLPHIDRDSIWHEELTSVAGQLTDACRVVDPQSTDQMIESAKSGDWLQAAASGDASATAARDSSN